MSSGIIGAHLRRTNRNLLLSGAILLAALAGALALGRRYLYNFARGPFAVEAADLGKAWDAGDPERTWVTVTGAGSEETGLQEIEQKKSKSGALLSERPVAKFLVFFVKDRILVVKAPLDAAQGAAFTGEVVRIPSYVERDLVAHAEAEAPNLRGVFYPFMLDATSDFRLPGFFAIGAALLAFLLGARNVKKAVDRWADPAQHPMSKRLAALGDAHALADAIDLEAADPAAARIGKVTITASWLLKATAFNAKILPLADLIWAYKKVVKHSHNFIPTGKTYHALLHDRAGGVLEIKARQKKIDALLEETARRAPWMIGGYSVELAATWKTAPARLIAAVDDRRKKLAAAPQA